MSPTKFIFIFTQNIHKFHQLELTTTPQPNLYTALTDLDDQDDIQARVAQLVTTSLAPLGKPHGKRLFAHYYVRRGAKRTRTSLGELSIPEYTYGFMCLINSPETFAHDKPFMLKHLSNLNEDATTYEWPGVKNWSEEVCALIAQGDLTWDDDYKIDFMRLKFSQLVRLPLANAPHFDQQREYHRDALDMSSHVRHIILETAPTMTPCSQWLQAPPCVQPLCPTKELLTTLLGTNVSLLRLLEISPQSLGRSWGLGSSP